MPNVMNEWENEINDGKPINGYYVYGWVCEDWGGVYFYVGKGVKDRYKEINSRGTIFKSILSHWNCFPVILVDGLTEKEAFIKEKECKERFIFEMGFPIMDGEDALRTMACRHAKEEKKKNDPNYREGRKPVEYDKEMFAQLFKLVARGELSISEASKKLGISRAKWYRIVKEAA